MVLDQGHNNMNAVCTCNIPACHLPMCRSRFLSAFGAALPEAMTEYIAEVEVQKLGRTKAHTKARGRLRPKPLLSAKEGEVWHPSSLSGRLRDWSSFGDTALPAQYFGLKLEMSNGLERAPTADLVCVYIYIYIYIYIHTYVRTYIHTYPPCVRAGFFPPFLSGCKPWTPRGTATRQTQVSFEGNEGAVKRGPLRML